MALTAGHIRSAGSVFDAEGRRVLLTVAGGAPLDPTHVKGGGRVLDADGREVIVDEGVTTAQVASILGLERIIRGGQAELDNAAAAATRLLNYAFANAVAPATDLSNAAFHLDPNRWPATLAGKNRRFKMLGSLLTNATAPTGNFTFDLRPVSSVAGGANVVTAVIGAAVASSGFTISAPGASTLNSGASADFEIAAAGYYVLALTNSAALAASAAVSTFAEICVHYV